MFICATCAADWKTQTLSISKQVKKCYPNAETSYAYWHGCSHNRNWNKSSIKVCEMNSHREGEGERETSPCE